MRRAESVTKNIPFVAPKGCVFRTIMGEESSKDHLMYKTPEKVLLAVNEGLAWIVEAQQANGG
jgi:hypothetical protein